jgi:hypothetical protein
VIEAKYRLKRRGWCLEEARCPYGVSLWRNIRNGWGSFSNFLSYKVGDCSHINFWHDVWCGIEPLKHSFSDLYSIARNKEVSVANYLDLSSSLIHWNPSLLGLHMIRNWNLLTHSLVSYIPQSCIQGKWTTCCGLPLVARNL